MHVDSAARYVGVVCIVSIISTYPMSTETSLPDTLAIPSITGTAWCLSQTLQAKYVSNPWVIYFACNVLSITRCTVNVLCQSIHASRFCCKIRGCRLHCFYYIYLPDVNRDFTSRYGRYSLHHRNCLVFIRNTASKVSQQSMSHVFCLQCFSLTCIVFFPYQDKIECFLSQWVHTYAHFLFNYV